VAAILVGVLKWQTQFWKRTTQESFQQSLVEIGSVVKVPKFELYKHNDELFNIYYGIFYELWTFADFDRLCKLEKRGDEIKKNLQFGWDWLNSFREDFFRTIGMHRKRIIGAECECIAKSMVTFFKWSGDRFTKVIVNRKSKITLKISLRTCIRAFH
jgi:hypothetical protein